MGGSEHLSNACAMLCAGGGLLGYIKKKSVPSLVAGSLIGLSYAYSSYLMRQGEHRSGHGVALTTSVILVAALGPRFYRTRQFMPSGLLTGVGLLTIPYQAMKFSEWSETEETESEQEA